MKALVLFTILLPATAFAQCEKGQCMVKPRVISVPIDSGYEYRTVWVRSGFLGLRRKPVRVRLRRGPAIITNQQKFPRFKSWTEM